MAEVTACIATCIAAAAVKAVVGIPRGALGVVAGIYAALLQSSSSGLYSPDNIQAGGVLTSYLQSLGMAYTECVKLVSGCTATCYNLIQQHEPILESQ